MIFPFGNRCVFSTFCLELCYNTFLLTRYISFNLNTLLICIHFYSRTKSVIQSLSHLHSSSTFLQLNSPQDLQTPFRVWQQDMTSRKINIGVVRASHCPQPVTGLPLQQLPHRSSWKCGSIKGSQIWCFGPPKRGPNEPLEKGRACGAQEC